MTTQQQWDTLLNSEAGNQYLSQLVSQAKEDIAQNNVVEMTQSSKIYIFHSDPGHGWLAVKLKELEDLGIADKISPYSYQKGKTVYLEEDCDMGIFIKAKKVQGIDIQYRDSYLDKTPIRYYSGYSYNKNE